MTASRDTIESVKDTIYKSCLLLDDFKFKDWLELCDSDFTYAITAYSPEIRREMTYFSGNRQELSGMVDLLPKHNTDHSPFTRHATVYNVDLGADGKTAEAITAVLIYQNMLDGINSHIDSGENRLFVVGRYLDTFRLNGGAPKFVRRQVRLETRRLDKGSHYPL
jgi:methanesulfonate monooxygenase small subunit